MIALLVIRNALRHPLRSALTILGVAVALLAFCLIQTLLDAWHMGVEKSAKDRLITRNRISLIFPLPISYKTRIEQVPGARLVAYANWFGGEYKDNRLRFAQFAVDSNYLSVYPEFLITTEELGAFNENRKGALIGQGLAELTDLKRGDSFQIQGTIYPGLWEFQVAGIVRPRDSTIITREMYFHWDYLNDRNKFELARNPDHVGVFITQLHAGADPAQVSRAIDQLFANSYAETLTESETAFVRGFLSMSSSIITSLQVISYVVLVILLLVMANTMLLAARERSREFAVLKALGFGTWRLMAIVAGESLALGVAGFLLLCAILAPVFTVLADSIRRFAAGILPVFNFNPMILLMAFIFMFTVALIAGVLPAWEVSRMRVHTALRRLD